MFKKIVLTTSFLLFVGVIIIGAIYRTEARINLVSSPANATHDEEIDQVASTANGNYNTEVDSPAST